MSSSASSSPSSRPRPPPARQDCRLFFRDFARILLYPLFLLNWAVISLGCLLCLPCICVYCRRKQAEWSSTDEYPHLESDQRPSSFARERDVDAGYVALEEGAAAGGRGDQEDDEEEGVRPEAARVSRGMSLDPIPPPRAEKAPQQEQQRQQQQQRPSTTTAPPPPWHAGPDLREVGYSNFYYTAKDGTKLAVDVWLPPRLAREPGAKVGCVLHQARYYRSFKLWGPGYYARRGMPVNFINRNYFDRFLEAGLAIVSFDVRGSGASHGQNRGPWMLEETEDSLGVLDWIVQQPWSNGAVGLWGISYEGTRALLTGIAGHPAVAAVCPMYIFLDIFRDVGFIGGIHLRGFIHSWETITRLLDSNKLPPIAAPFAWFAIDGVQPVTSAPGGGLAELRAAVKEHADNWSSTKDGHAVEYVDDRSVYNGLCAADISPYVRVDAWLRAKKAERARAAATEAGAGAGALGIPAFFLISGWFDSTASCAIKLAYHLRDVTDDVKLLVGPWNHAGVQHVRCMPEAATGFRRFDAPEEVALWFKDKLASPPPPPKRSFAASLPRVRYYTMQEEAWKTPQDGRFPMPGPDSFATLRLAAPSNSSDSSDATGNNNNNNDQRRPRGRRPWAGQRGRLLMEGSPAGGSEVEEEQPGQGKLTLPVHIHRARVSKGVSRYRAMTHVMMPIEYDFEGDRRIRHLHFTSPPLTAPLEVTGFPTATLFVSSSAADASVFVYLQCVDARGRAHYVTEGCLRASSRKLVPQEDEAERQLEEDSVLSYPRLPHHSFRREDAQFLEPGGAPVEVTIALQPTSYRFLPGQSVRLAVAGADPVDFLPLRFPDGGVSYDLTVHTGPGYPSRLVLPTPAGGDV